MLVWRNYAGKSNREKFSHIAGAILQRDYGIPAQLAALEPECSAEDSPSKLARSLAWSLGWRDGAGWGSTPPVPVSGTVRRSGDPLGGVMLGDSLFIRDTGEKIRCELRPVADGAYEMWRLDCGAPLHFGFVTFTA